MCAKLISWVQRDRYVGLDVCGRGTEREETREGTIGRGKSLKKKEGEGRVIRCKGQENRSEAMGGGISVRETAGMDKSKQMPEKAIIKPNCMIIQD